MKKLFFLGLFMPLFVVCQKPTVISYNRYLPKNEKVLEFEKGLKSHATKYHSAEWKWRVYDIQSGPDAGGYLVIEGPVTWDQVDKRGTLGKEHTEDFLKNVLPHTTDKNSLGFVVFREELSSVALTDYADKIAITHVFPKPGKLVATEETIKQLKKMWDASEQSVAVYESSASGQSHYLVVTRYKQGLKEREFDFRKPMKERYDAANGEGSYDKFVTSTAENIEHIWSEMLFLNTDLSPK